jgi:hypothetical protein
MFNQKFLVLRCTALSNFVAQDLLQVFEESIVESSCAVALFARKTLLVDLLSIALKALRQVFNIFNGLISSIQIVVLRLDDETLDVLLLTNVILLLTLRLNHDFGEEKNIQCLIIKPEDYNLNATDEPIENIEDLPECFKCDGKKINKKGLPCKKCNGTGRLNNRFFKNLQ